MTASMTNRAVRVVDPVLTTVAIGYRNPAFVAEVLFPRVPVDKAGGQIIEFGKESFLKYNLRRAPGTAVARITFGYAGKPYSLFQDAVEVPMPWEHYRETPLASLGTMATKKGMDIVLKSYEDEAAAMAVNAALYPAGNKVALAGGTKWSTATGVPINDIDTGAEAIRQQTGVRPNTLLLSAQAYLAAKNNPQVTDRFKFTNGKGVVTTDMLAELFNVKRVAVGDAISMTDAGVASDIWGNNAILAYVAENPADMDTPSFGFTYALRGHPLVEVMYQEENVKSDIFPVTYERAPAITAIAAGYLIQNPF